MAGDNAEAGAGAESGSDTDGASEATGGNDTLNLRLTADSWIEIYDRYGNKLYVNLARKSEEITLVGAAPFSVKLGFSQGVILEFNGEPFDPAPYSHAGVATFTLGE